MRLRSTNSSHSYGPSDRCRAHYGSRPYAIAHRGARGVLHVGKHEAAGMLIGKSTLRRHGCDRQAGKPRVTAFCLGWHPVS